MNRLNTAFAAAALLTAFTSSALEQDPSGKLTTANPQTAPAPHGLSAPASDAQHRTIEAQAALTKARQELWQATEAYAGGDHAAVKAYLQQAQTWLWAVGPDVDPKTRAEAERLHAEITELLAREAHRGDDAESDIGGFWHRAAALVERQAETLLHTWHDPQEKHHFYRAIIEAKLHLSYARHELFVRYDPERARAELARTDLYLSEAAANVPAREAQLAAARDDVAALHELSDVPTPELCQRYDALVVELDDWIEEI